jgi:hypothetical protein
MKYSPQSLPKRQTPSGEVIETRPLYVEEWLDSLPYVDFKLTSRLLYEATKATNETALDAKTRLELAEIYNRPYRYYVDSQVRAGAQHTLQSIETMQGQIEVLKMIAVNLGRACRMAADEALRKPTLWGQKKPPLREYLCCLHYLSHALVFSYLEYAPTPKGVWRELHGAYQYAANLKQQGVALVPPGGNAKTDSISIENAYKRIVMTSMVDPHHLPFGAVWEIFEQLGSWAQHVEIAAFRAIDRPGGWFVSHLAGDDRPVHYLKFDRKTATNQHVLLDAGALGGLIEQEQDRLDAGKGLSDKLKLSPYFARTVLAQLLRSWGLPPNRSVQRTRAEGSVQVAAGLNSIYFHVNGKQEFRPAPIEQDNEEVEETTPAPSSAQNYDVDQWDLVDEAPGGMAIMRVSKPGRPARVGELLAISRAGAAGPWQIGTVRWLMMSPKNNMYRIGVQFLAKTVRPVEVRATTGSREDIRFRRGLMIKEAGGDGRSKLITERGLFAKARQLELRSTEESRRMVAESILEAAAGFEYFESSTH